MLTNRTILKNIFFYYIKMLFLVKMNFTCFCWNYATGQENFMLRMKVEQNDDTEHIVIKI